MDDEGPTVTILLLGSPECGKSSFLSCVSQGRDLTSQTRPSLSQPRPAPVPASLNPPSYSTLPGIPSDKNPPSSSIPSHTHSPAPPPPAVTSLPLLRDSDQPFTFSIRMYSRPYRFEFYDTSSPTNYTLLQPDLVILCFDVVDKRSLEEVQMRWRKEVSVYFGRDREGFNGEKVPVALVGLKRDLRDVFVAKGRGGEVVDPLEAYRIAQEMRCDRYAECSALTGELVNETFEDIARVAAMTTTETGGQTQHGACALM